jgi:hypothetical protein
MGGSKEEQTHGAVGNLLVIVVIGGAVKSLDGQRNSFAS